MTPQSESAARSLAAEAWVGARQWEARPMEALLDAKEELAMKTTWHVLANDLSQARLHARAYELIEERRERTAARKRT